MSPTHRETILYGDQAQILSREEDHTHYRLPSPDGEVLLTAYPVFPGIEIIYNDVHAASCQLVRGRRPGLLAEKFCKESPYFAARSSAGVEHIFSQLYSVPEAVRKGYFR